MKLVLEITKNKVDIIFVDKNKTIIDRTSVKQFEMFQESELDISTLKNFPEVIRFLKDFDYNSAIYSVDDDTLDKDPESFMYTKDYFTMENLEEIINDFEIVVGETKDGQLQVYVVDVNGFEYIIEDDELATMLTEISLDTMEDDDFLEEDSKDKDKSYEHYEGIVYKDSSDASEWYIMKDKDNIKYWVCKDDGKITPYQYIDGYYIQRDSDNKYYWYQVDTGIKDCPVDNHDYEKYINAK